MKKKKSLKSQTKTQPQKTKKTVLRKVEEAFLYIEELCEDAKKALSSEEKVIKPNGR